MTDYLQKKFEDLDVTQEELSQFSEALKKEEFRKLLAEYAEEISNPENRKLYEKELEQLENERGVDVTFIHPDPGFVLKTTQDGDKKCFLNICKNTNINKPTSDVTQKSGANGSIRKGITWSIPHSCAPPREDIDKSGKPCVVYDVVFHPDAYRMGETNEKFKQLLIDTAFDTIEQNFKVKLDRKNIKKLQMPFKGTPTASVIRRVKEDSQEQKFDLNDENDPLTKIKTPYAYPPAPMIDPKNPSVTEKAPTPAPVKTETKKPVNQDDEYTTPKYTLIHRGAADIQDCAEDKSHSYVNSTRPKELYIEIDLPLCKNASNVKLDIYEKSLHLESQKPFYKLDISLPYPVNENDGNAKFDKTKKKLCITLPAIAFNMKMEERQLIVEQPVTTTTTSQKSEQLEIPIAPSAMTSQKSDKASENDDELNKPVKARKDSTPLKDVSNTPSVAATSSSENVICDAASQPAPTPTNESQIKYVFPDKFELKQNKKFFKLIFHTNNINGKSLGITQTQTDMFIKYESVSSGGYTTYYSIYLKFKNDFIDVAIPFTIEGLNKRALELRFSKLDTHCVESTSVGLNQNDSNPMDFNIAPCEEDEVKDESEKTELKQSGVKLVSTETFTLSMSNELDEDDCEPTVATTTTTLEEQKCAESTGEQEKPDDKVTETKECPFRQGSSDSDELSSSMNAPKLKSILKKPRSVSESESQSSSRSDSSSSSELSHRSVYESSNNSSRNRMTSTCTSNTGSDELVNEQKKSVKFNQEIKRTVFKASAAIADLKKAHTSKNRKRNQRRKRTISDPSDSAYKVNNVRERSYSESSDDGTHHNYVHNVNSNSEEDLNSHDDDGNEQDGQQVVEEQSQQHREEKVREVVVSKEVKNHLNMETMLSWKAADGNNNNNEFVEKTKCAFKFTNSIIYELDD